MDISNGIRKINLKEEYTRPILGLGEIYEIMSVERKRKNLLRKFGQGEIFLAANKEHSGHGITLADLKNYLKSQGFNILDTGYIDSPPFASRPLSPDQKRFYADNLFINYFAKIIFWFLIWLEFLWQGPKKSHMVFGLVKKQ